MTDASKFLDTARRVIRIEADALALLANEVGTPFGQAVQMILDAPGRIIVCGMGKSGHVARKIAAQAHPRISFTLRKRAMAILA
jgi:arabinose-5-phosphate isomerase